MIRYVAIRLAMLVAGLLIASAIIFCTLRVLPGDAAQLIAGTESTPEQVEAIREQMGLNAPVLSQYLSWLGGVLRGDLGTSLITGSSVAAQLAEKAQVTLPLSVMSLAIAVVIALPFGIWAATRHRKIDGRAIGLAAQMIAAVPIVWAGMMLVVVFAVILGWLPAQGFPRSGWRDPIDALQSLLLPALTIGVVEGALLLRFVRSATLQAASADHVRTAASLGMTRLQALLRHGLPSVAISLVTVLGLQTAGIIVGSVVVEQVFTLPGIGRMLVADVGARDLPKVQGELFVFTAVVLIVSFAVDLIHLALDPRLRDAT